MQFLTYLALAATAVLAAPTGPAEVGSIVAEAQAAGIDVDGPIPADAVQVADGHFTAAPGTQAWTWIRAQIDQTAVNDLKNETESVSVEKRQQYANIGIGMFAQDWCNGQAAWFDNVRYGIQHYTATNMYSVGISYRGLRSDEQLDFSRQRGNDYCGTYIYSAGRNTGTGCFNSQRLNCFRLTAGH